jgi:hypothetical protein
MTVLVALLALAAAGFGVMLALRDRPGGIGWLWDAVFGPVDQGPVRFDTLRRRSWPNDALVCPPGLCSAKADIVPPLYSVSAEELRRRLAAVILDDDA